MYILYLSLISKPFYFASEIWKIKYIYRIVRVDLKIVKRKKVKLLVYMFIIVSDHNFKTKAG